MRKEIKNATRLLSSIQIWSFTRWFRRSSTIAHVFLPLLFHPRQISHLRRTRFTKFTTCFSARNVMLYDAIAVSRSKSVATTVLIVCSRFLVQVFAVKRIGWHGAAKSCNVIIDLGTLDVLEIASFVLTAEILLPSCLLILRNQRTEEYLVPHLASRPSSFIAVIVDGIPPK
jgi:hypothetical protein